MTLKGLLEADLTSSDERMEDDLEGHLAGPCDFLEDDLNMTSSDEAGG
jgi:hypothetical protein